MIDDQMTNGNPAEEQEQETNPGDGADTGSEGGAEEENKGEEGGM